MVAAAAAFEQELEIFRTAAESASQFLAALPTARDQSDFVRELHNPTTPESGTSAGDPLCPSVSS